MNSKLTYVFSLVSFFLIWGVLGMAATPSHSGAALQATEPAGEVTPVPQETSVGGIPITGQAEPEPLLTEIIVFYGLIGITAMFLTLALLNVANRSTIPSRERKRPSGRDPRNN